MGTDPDFVFGVDLDGVCAQYHKALKWVVEDMDGHEFDSLPADHDWWFSEWGLSEETFPKYHEELVVARRGYGYLEPFPGVSEALWRLSDAGVYIRIITHRLTVPGHHVDLASDTVLWLEQNDIPYRDLCFMGDKASTDADLYVDDAPHNIAALQEAGRNVVIFDHHYNRDVEGIRVSGWSELADLVLKRADTSGKVWP